MNHRANPEQIIHRAVAAHLRTRPAPGLVWFHVAQSNYAMNARGVAIQASVNKALGTRKGVSDLILLHRSRFYALELKARGNKPTLEQLQFMDDVKDADGFAAWADSVDRAVAILESWQLLVGRMQWGAAA